MKKPYKWIFILYVIKSNVKRVPAFQTVDSQILAMYSKRTKLYQFQVQRNFLIK